MRAVRLRKGPNSKSPVSYILTTPHYPLKVTQAYENWRQVADHTGVLGWIHKSFVIPNDKHYAAILTPCTLTQKDTGQTLARLPKGFIVELVQKTNKECFVIVKDPNTCKKITGLVPCSVIWGE